MLQPRALPHARRLGVDLTKKFIRLSTQTRLFKKGADITSDLATLLRPPRLARFGLLKPATRRPPIPRLRDAGIRLPPPTSPCFNPPLACTSHNHRKKFGKLRCAKFDAQFFLFGKTMTVQPPSSKLSLIWKVLEVHGPHRSTHADVLDDLDKV